MTGQSWEKIKNSMRFLYEKRVDFMKKKSAKKWMILACMAVMLAAAVVVGILVGPPLLKQREFQRNRQAQLDFQKLDASASLSYYDEKTPLCQVEPNELAQVFPQASTALGTVQPEDARFLELPVDLHYYSQPDASGEPAATIPKGTVVTLYPQSSFFSTNRATAWPATLTTKRAGAMGRCL